MLLSYVGYTIESLLDLKDKGAGGVADAGVLHILALAALCVLEKLKVHLVVALILQ